jgi:hypothetical protein
MVLASSCHIYRGDATRQTIVNLISNSSDPPRCRNPVINANHYIGGQRRRVHAISIKAILFDKWLSTRCPVAQIRQGAEILPLMQTIILVDGVGKFMPYLSR